MKKRFIFILPVVFLLSGCASSDDFLYVQPEPIDEKTVMVKTETIAPFITAMHRKNIPIDEDLVEEQVRADEKAEPTTYEDEIFFLDESWEYADYTAIHNDGVTLHRAKENRKEIVIAIDPGHGTTGAEGKKMYCHPDQSVKTTGGSTAAGAVQANAQSSGMTFRDGTGEGIINLKVSRLVMSSLLESGYDVLMLRDSEKIELDLLARTLIANHYADCHISLHFDGDNLDYDKGAFYIAVPDGIKDMPPVDSMWRDDDRLGECIIQGLNDNGVKIYNDGKLKIDLMQTSYSSIPSVDIELGNQCSDVGDNALQQLANGVLAGINLFYQ